MKTKRIDIIGVLASGKSTLLKKINENNALPSNTASILEDLTPLDSARLFWEENPENRSYYIQSTYYMHRLKQYLNTTSDTSTIISDFSLFCDHFVYSKSMHKASLLHTLEFNSLDYLYEITNHQAPKCRGIIYREVDYSTVLKRISIRNNQVGLSPFFKNFVSILCTETKSFIATTNVPMYIIPANLDIKNEGSDSNLFQEISDFILKNTQ